MFLVDNCGSWRKCPLCTGFYVMFTGSKFSEFFVFWTILWKLFPAKIIAKLLMLSLEELVPAKLVSLIKFVWQEKHDN